MNQPQQSVQYRQYMAGKFETIVNRNVIAEAPVALTVNGEVWLTFMCTPVQLEALAAGFLYNEGIIQSKDEIASVRVCQHGDNVDVWLHHEVEQPKHWKRTSGCTGGVTSVELDGEAPANLINVQLPAGDISSLVEKFLQAQGLYKTAGGVHTSALSDGEKIHITADDIGRHNTLDKLAGHLLLKAIHLEKRVLLTTGRISSEMLQKAGRMGTAIVISRTSPSSLSIDLAEKFGITLVGYAKRHRFNIYTHPHRILAEEV